MVGSGIRRCRLCPAGRGEGTLCGNQDLRVVRASHAAKPVRLTLHNRRRPCPWRREVPTPHLACGLSWRASAARPCPASCAGSPYAMPTLSRALRPMPPRVAREPGLVTCKQTCACAFSRKRPGHMLRRPGGSSAEDIAVCGITSPGAAGIAARARVYHGRL